MPNREIYRFPFHGPEDPFVVNGNEVLPSNTLMWTMCKLWSERRFMMTNQQGVKEPYLYMKTHTETVYQHLLLLQERIADLYDKIPGLQSEVDIVYLRKLAWLHEADEILDGDVSYLDQFLFAFNNGKTDQKLHDLQVQKLKVSQVLEILFPDDSEQRNQWVDDVSYVDFYQQTNSQTKNVKAILILKLLDMITGNNTVILHGTNLNQFGDQQKMLIEPKLNSLTMKLHESGLSIDLRKQLDEKIIAPHVADLNRAGIGVGLTCHVSEQ